MNVISSLLAVFIQWFSKAVLEIMTRKCKKVGWSCARKLQGPLKEQEIRIIAAEVESMESVESVLIYCRMIVSAMRGFHLFNFGKFLQKWQLAWHDGTWNMKGWALLSPGWDLLKFQTCPQVTNATFACTPLNVAFFFGLKTSICFYSTRLLM